MANPTVRRLEEIVVFYGTAIELEIASGRPFAHVDPGFTSENYPSERRGVVRVQPHVVRFDERFDSTDALKGALLDIGLEVVDLWTLLRFDNGFPRETARGLPALGSLRKDGPDRYFPYVVEVSGHRLLRETMLPEGSYWTEKATILAIPKR